MLDYDFEFMDDDTAWSEYVELDMDLVAYGDEDAWNFADSE